MKQVIKLRPGHYLHVDVYPPGPAVRTKSIVENLLISAMVTGIAFITVGAMFGIDMTQQFNQWQRPQNTSSTLR